MKVRMCTDFTEKGLKAIKLLRAAGYDVSTAIVEGMNEPEIYIKDLPSGGSVCIMSLKELRQFLKKKTKPNQIKGG